MTSALDLQAAAAVAKAGPVADPRPTSDPFVAKKAATEFEGVFLAQIFGEMFQGISADGPFGGGQGEEMFRSLMFDEYGKQVAAQGGFGLANAMTRELLKIQEAHP